MIYTPIYINEKPEDKKRYLKTHNLSDPGYQKDREYNWPVDKHNYVFGKPQVLEFGGTEKSLKSDFLEGLYPKTKIVEKRYDDFTTASKNLVGRAKFHGSLHHSIDADFVFGRMKKKEGFISNAGIINKININI